MTREYLQARSRETGLKDKKGASGREGQTRFHRAEARRSREKKKKQIPRLRPQKPLASLGMTNVGDTALEVPEGGVGFVEGETNVPCFVVAPDDLRFGGASGF